MAGALDRTAAVAEVLARLGAARSAWNAADMRGEVEQLLARAGIVIDPAVRLELAEDITARAVDACACSLHDGAPEHIRALTSQHVLDVEADLVARLAVARRRTRSRRSCGRSRRSAANGHQLDAGRRPSSPRWPATGRWS